MLLKNFQLLRHEKYHVLTTESSIFVLFLSGILAAVCLFGFVFYTGTLIFDAKTFSFFNTSDLGADFWIFSSIISILIGVLASRIRKYEYISLAVSYKKSEFFKISFYLLYIFFFILLFYPAFIYFLPIWVKNAGQSFINVLPVVFLLSLLVTWMIRNLWDVFFRFFLQILSPIDWRLIMDRKHFAHMLKLKYSEVKRYQGPLSLMIIAIRNMDDLKKQFSKGKIKKMLLRSMDYINNSIRNLDLVGRVEEGQFIAALLHTAGRDARIPAERINEKIKELGFFTKHGKAVSVEISIGISSYDQTMDNETALLLKTKEALAQAIEQGQNIVYL